jgi:hypothetical protein
MARLGSRVAAYSSRRFSKPNTAHPNHRACVPAESRHDDVIPQRTAPERVGAVAMRGNEIRGEDWVDGFHERF